jgi:hypothetical protein
VDKKLTYAGSSGKLPNSMKDYPPPLEYQIINQTLAVTAGVFFIKLYE